MGRFYFLKKTPPTGEWEGGPKRNKHYTFIIKNLWASLLLVCVKLVMLI